MEKNQLPYEITEHLQHLKKDKMDGNKQCKNIEWEKIKYPEKILNRITNYNIHHLNQTQ